MKRGQAAMEYLFTYGWAILAVVSAIAVLSWMGVFSASQFVSEQCTFQPDFPCTNHILAMQEEAQTAVLKFRISNGFGSQVRYTNFNATIDGNLLEGAMFDAQGTELLPTDIIGQGAQTDFEISGISAQKGSVKEILTNLEYANCQTASDETCTDASKHSITGKIVAKAE